jgi:hypothetical protein
MTQTAHATATIEDMPSDREIAGRPKSQRFDGAERCWGWSDEIRRRWSARPGLDEVLHLALQLAPARAVGAKIGVSPQTAIKLAADLEVHMMIMAGAAARLPDLVDLFGTEIVEPAKASAEVEADAPKNGARRP